MHLFRYAPGVTAKKIAVVTIPNAGLSNAIGNLNGDIAFDGDGNLLITVSNTNIARTAVLTSDKVLQAINGSTASTPVSLNSSGWLTSLTPPGNTAMNGIAFTGNGKLILEQGSQQRMVSPFTFGNLTPAGSATIPTGASALVDLASCMTPPTLTVKKNVIDRANSTDQFTLSAIYSPGQNQVSLGTSTTTGTATGIQAEQVGPEPVLSPHPDTQGIERNWYRDMSLRCQLLPELFNRQVLAPRCGPNRARVAVERSLHCNLAHLQQRKTLPPIR